MIEYFDTPPPPEVIAQGLSTVPRWTARTILDRVGLRWSVLQHSLVCAQVAGHHEPDNPLLRLTALLHDAEEFVTGDIPRPYKTLEQREQGDEIRWEILRGLGLPEPSESLWRRVHEIDQDVGLAERWVLLHPSEVLEKDKPAPDMDVVSQVWGLLDIDARSAIELYTEMVYDLLEVPTIKTLAGRI